MQVIIEGFKVDKDHLRFLDKGLISKTRELVYYYKFNCATNTYFFVNEACNAGSNLVCLKFMEYDSNE